MIPVTIKWGPIICDACETCICSTQIEYKQRDSSVWTFPVSPTNPTQDLQYTIYIEQGIHYEAKVTFIGPRCNSKYSIIPLFVPTGQCCPVGYILSPDGTYCYRIDDVAATPPSGTPQTLVASTNIAYSTCGSFIYNTGYAQNGTGVSNRINVGNAFWVNGIGDCVDNSSSAGPLNRTGLWVTPALGNQDIGFGVCVELTQSKTYYIGIGSDNYGVIKVDGNIIIQQDASALGTQYGVGISATFKVWHIYPVLLSSGPHIIEITGHNISSSAAIGCEIYSATSDELIAATSYGDLGEKLIFSSKDYVGEQAQIGTGNAGYTCPSGYTLAPCSNPIKCRRILTIPTIAC